MPFKQNIHATVFVRVAIVIGTHKETQTLMHTLSNDMKKVVSCAGGVLGQQAKMPPSSCWVPSPSSDQTGMERAARMKAAALAKARASRAAAEDDVQRAIASISWHR